MGISRDKWHKRRSTGGKVKAWCHKHKYELGRPPAQTRIGPKRVRTVRTRGGNIKHRGLRLDTGTFSWGSELTSSRSRIIKVSFNSSNNELVRTNTLVKNAIVQVDATPFRLFYEKKYGLPLSKRSTKKEDDAATTKSKSVEKKIAARKPLSKLEPSLEQQFNTGRLYAAITSRPGQSGRCDGRILEGAELAFYLKKMVKGKK